MWRARIRPWFAGKPPVTLCWSPEPGRAIGKGVVECLAQDGATVAINYRVSAADAEQLVAELEKNR
jgi:Dehydrogenases with different specificities (related to short-chain alcohol dehydrogenases)